MQDNNYNGIPDHMEGFGSHGSFSRDRRRRSGRGVDLSGAPSWAKACVWIGTLVALAGFGISFFELLGTMSSIAEPIGNGFPSTTSSFPERPSTPDVRLGFGLFFGGAALAVVGQLGAATSRRH